MPATELLILFTLTTFLVVLAPGPAAIAVAAESARSGYSRGTPVILGVACANALYFALSATGISALILASSTLFAIIKWAGVVFLLWLGLQAIFARSGGFVISQDGKAAHSKSRSFLRGFIIEMANPKALLYFAALLPQFIDPNQPVLPQFILFGLLTFLIDFVVYSGYGALGAKTASTGLKPVVTRWINRAAGGLLIFAGLSMARVER